MSFGLITAQEGFQSMTGKKFEGIPRIKMLIDDIFISETTREDQDANVRMTFGGTTERPQACLEKLNVCTQEVDSSAM